MGRRFILAIVFVLMMVSLSFAATAATLETNFSQGGNKTQTRAIIGSGQLYTGPCRIISINYFASTAGSYAGIYNTINTGYPIADIEFEMGTSANNSSVSALGGYFNNGIRVLSTNATAVTTAVFDY